MGVLACFCRLCEWPEFSSFRCRAPVLEERNNHVPLSFASAIQDRGGWRTLTLPSVRQ